MARVQCFVCGVFNFSGFRVNNFMRKLKDVFSIKGKLYESSKQTKNMLLSCGLLITLLFSTFYLY